MTERGRVREHELAKINKMLKSLMYVDRVRVVDAAVCRVRKNTALTERDRDDVVVLVRSILHGDEPHFPENEDVESTALCVAYGVLWMHKYGE